MCGYFASYVKKRHCNMKCVIILSTRAVFSFRRPFWSWFLEILICSRLRFLLPLVGETLNGRESSTLLINRTYSRIWNIRCLLIKTGLKIPTNTSLYAAGLRTTSRNKNLKLGSTIMRR